LIGRIRNELGQWNSFRWRKANLIVVRQAFHFLGGVRTNSVSATVQIEACRILNSQAMFHWLECRVLSARTRADQCRSARGKAVHDSAARQRCIPPPTSQPQCRTFERRKEAQGPYTICVVQQGAQRISSYEREEGKLSITMFLNLKSGDNEGSMPCCDLMRI
jgi:hypothetical protein